MPIKNKVCHEYPLTVKLEYMALTYINYMYECGWYDPNTTAKTTLIKALITRAIRFDKTFPGVPVNPLTGERARITRYRSIAGYRLEEVYTALPKTESPVLRLNPSQAYYIGWWAKKEGCPRQVIVNALLVTMAAHDNVFRNMRLGIEAEALYIAAGLDPYKRDVDMSAALNYQN